MTSWPGVTQAALHRARPPAGRLGGRVLLRLLVLELGLGAVDLQFGLDDGSRSVWCDLRVGRHVFEFDGRQK